MRKSMDVALLADIILDILQRTNNSLAPPATRLSAEYIQQFEILLNRIRDMVQKVNPNNSQDDEVISWLRKVKEVVNELKDFMEDLQQSKESSTTDVQQSKESSTTDVPQSKESSRTDVSITVARLIKSMSNITRPKVPHQIKNSEAEFKRLQSQANKLPFSQEAATEERKFPDIYHEFQNFEAIGRKNDKKEIISELREGALPISVVSLVGIAGIGKTKLARLVCKDKQVEDHFGSPIWVHDNETFDEESIAQHVTETAANGKRFLLVLDDFTNEIGVKKFIKLEQKLTEVAASAAGAILITTRSNLVANKIATAARGGSGAVKLHALQRLNQEDSWSLFQKVRGRSSSNKEWEMVREYCCGVPLAIITIAKLLNSHKSSVSKPEEVPALQEEFLQELKFTYYYQLPLQHKLCFAYFSLFPQHYSIKAESLIHLWIAEGFLRKDDSQEFGSACFKDFVPFIFLQEEKQEFYKMNPLMHELARIVAWDENITVDSKGEKVDERVLRVSFDFALDVQCGMPESLFEKAKKLRTILLLAETNKLRLPHEVKMTTSTCDKIFESFKRLRVLDLHDLGIRMLPSSIGQMKHLRYLDLSNNNIEKLPNAITKLLHLQTLKLSQCHVLKELPKDLEHLCYLRHLHLEGCLDLTHMPSGIKNLSSLQTLSLFVASKKYSMGGLEELTDLSNLRGHLEILHLEQLKLSASSEAEKKYLNTKEHLHCLTLRWDYEEEKKEGKYGVEAEKKYLNTKEHLHWLPLRWEEKKEGNDREIKSLDCLEPNRNLKELLVVGYNGNMFSNWLSSIECLVKFSMNDCPKCQSLPPLHNLPRLRVLELRRLDSLDYIEKNNGDTGGNNEGSSSSTSMNRFFPSLKELTITDCPLLKGWWENEKSENKEDRPFFSCISKLHVQCCPKLDCMPLYPYLDEELILVDSSVKSMRETMHAKTSEDSPPFSKLKSMVIERIKQFPPERWLKNFTSLEKLHIRDCSDLESLPQGFNCLSSLGSLTIERCPVLDLDKSKTEWEGLKNLHSLTVKEIPKLKSLPWGGGNVTSLHEIGLYECSALTFLPESIGKLTSLNELVISECESLCSLPKEMENLKSLKTLIITGCPLLLPRCQPETGDDWPQISHIPNIQMKQSSQDLWRKTGLGKDF